MAKKKTKKSVKRISLVILLCLAINGYVFYYVGSILNQVYLKKKEAVELKDELIVLKEEEEKLQVEVNKLQDPSYVAKYARERFLYSKNGEYIVKIKD